MSQNLEARERVLSVAEELFREYGYAAVSLQDIAKKIGIRKPSLYYHFSGGKEELYLAVHERMFAAHAPGMQQAASIDGTLEERLNAIADWLLSHPPMFLIGLFHADLDRLSDEGKRKLCEQSFRSVISPIVQAFRAAPESAGDYEPHVAAALFLSAIEAFVHGERLGFSDQPVREMTLQAIRILVDGWNGCNGSGN